MKELVSKQVSNINSHNNILSPINLIIFFLVKGAGHMVPYYLPAQGYAFYETWLQEA